MSVSGANAIIKRITTQFCKGIYIYIYIHTYTHSTCV